MSGPRKKALVAGVYAAGSLGDIQGRKSGCFSGWRRCRKNPHAWLFGTECAVCSICGLAVPKSKVQQP